MALRKITAIFSIIFLGAFIIAPVFSPTAYASDPEEAGFRILPYCNPTIFPSQGTAEFSPIGSPDGSDNVSCGFSAFQQLIVNIIKWLLYIIIPIGIIILVWAGFKIMTSAGNSEKVHEAYGMIKIVVIGILIAALSFIIIVNIFNVLNVQNVKFNAVQ